MLENLWRQVSLVDGFAVGWFLACWIGYGLIAEHSVYGRRGLQGISHGYRLDWARQLLQREVRIVDSSLVGNLMTSVSFYANTTIYIIAGLMAVLSTLDKAISVAEDLPFARVAGRELWEVKVLLLLGVFVFAYFKFTWSLRQCNLLSILIGAAPASTATDSDHERFAYKLAAVNTLSGDEFNRGIRAYYFGLAALGWFIQPWLFMAVTALIVVVLYRRDFQSNTLRVLRD
jgi:uncharacterized membrane protein